MSMQTVEDTWAKLGHKIRATQSRVIVVTDEPYKKVGMLFLPEKLTSFYANMPHLVMVKSTVLSVGPKVSGIKPGDRVTFQRTQFTRLCQVSQNVMVGIIDQHHIAGFFSLEDEAPVEENQASAAG